MAAMSGKVRLSVQAKVLLVVLGFLVLLPLLVVWIVHLQTSRLALEQSRQALKTAEGVFRKYLDIREGNLVTGYRNLVTEPRFQAIVTQTQRDVATMNDFLRGLLGRRGEEGEALMFLSEKAEVLGGVRREGAVTIDVLERAVQPLLRAAYEGEASVGNLSLNDRAYTVIVHPVSPGQGGAVVGVLVSAVRVGEAALRDLRDLTGTEVALVANGRMIAATRADGAGGNAWLDEVLLARAGPPPEGQPVVVGGEHFWRCGCKTRWTGRREGWVTCCCIPTRKACGLWWTRGRPSSR